MIRGRGIPPAVKQGYGNFDEGIFLLGGGEERF